MLHMDELTTPALERAEPDVFLTLWGCESEPSPERTPLQQFRDKYSFLDQTALVRSLDLNNASENELGLLAQFRLVCNSDDLISNFITALVTAHFEQINSDEALTPGSIQGRLDGLKAIWADEVHVARWLLARHPELVKEVA